MICTPFKVGDATGFACSRSRRPVRNCGSCGRPGADRLCDGKLAAQGDLFGGGDPATCDKPLCSSCATKGPPLPDGDTSDFCPEHRT